MLCSWCKALTSKSWIGCSIDASLNSMGAIQFQNKQSMDKENFKEKKNCSKHIEWKSTHMSHFSQRFSHYCKSHFFTWVLGDKQLWIFEMYMRLTLYNAYCQLCLEIANCEMQSIMTSVDLPNAGKMFCRSSKVNVSLFHIGAPILPDRVEPKKMCTNQPHCWFFCSVYKTMNVGFTMRGKQLSYLR